MFSRQWYHHPIILLMTRISIGGLLVSSMMIRIAHAEITLDGSLGPKASLSGPDYVVTHTQGLLRGTNLFHSFGEFNVLKGESATFTGPVMIQSIIGRVTGGNESFIDGKVQSTIPGANLFLINPNGVLFGPNALLDVRGSFHVSTAEYVKLGEDGVFYADPTQSSIITVAPPSAFGFLSDGPAAIRLQESDLEVPEGNGLFLVGGKLQVEDCEVSAPSGNIIMASVNSSGEVTLDKPGGLVDIDFDYAVDAGEISLRGSGLDVTGDGSGTVFIRGGRFVMDASTIVADTRGYTHTEGLTPDAGRSDLINKLTADTTDEDHWKNRLATDSVGEIEVNVESLTLVNGAQIRSAGRADGTAGAADITIEAEESVTLSGSPDDPLATSIYILNSGEGDGGAISISTPNLTVDGKARIGPDKMDEGRAGEIILDVGRLTLSKGGGIRSISHPDSTGQAGNITITAAEGVYVSGDPDEVSPSFIRSHTQGEGDGGSIRISTPTLMLDNNAVIAVGTIGAGQAGDILLDTGSVRLRNGSFIYNVPFPESTGGGGNITIEATDEVYLSGDFNDMLGAAIYTDTFGSGDGGSISISTPSLRIENLAWISATPVSFGRAGDILLNVGSLRVADGAQILSIAPYGSTGDAGNINITATVEMSLSAEGHDYVYGDLSTSPTVISAETFGEGDGGTITISTPTLVVNDYDAWIETGTRGGDGDGGDISIHVENLILKNAGRIHAIAEPNSFGEVGTGHAGDIDITATESIWLSGVGRDIDSNIGPENRGAFIATSTSSEGDGGTVTISTPTLLLEDMGTIGSSTLGLGRAGEIVLVVDSLTAKGSAGCSTTTSGAADGGTISVTANDRIYASGEGSGFFSATEGSGTAGDIELHARTVVLMDEASISTGSTDVGNAGMITVDVSDTFRSDDGFVTVASEKADGGNIELNAGHLVHLISTKVTSSVGGGPETVGGNIAIDSSGYVILSDSDVIANAYAGRGGNVRIHAEDYLADHRSVVSASSDKGIDGTVDIRAPIISLSGFLSPLPKVFWGAGELLREPCVARIREGEYSSFIIGGRDGAPIEPGRVLPSPKCREREYETEDEPVLEGEPTSG